MIFCMFARFLFAVALFLFAGPAFAWNALGRNCGAELETAVEGVEGWTVTCPPADLTCPVCGVAGTYVGRDLHLRPLA
jgi:hypothetical protein